MNFKLTVYELNQIDHLTNEDQTPIILKRMTLSFPKNIKLSDYNFGIKIETKSFQPAFFAEDIAVFSKQESETALQNIYLLISTTNKPIIGKVIYKPNQNNFSFSNIKKLNLTKIRKSRTKNFMTPTPLHIPTSQISPVLDPFHERILILPIEKNQKLSSFHKQKITFLFPMVFIYKKKI